MAVARHFHTVITYTTKARRPANSDEGSVSQS